MADEARIQTSLQITTGSLQYQSRPTAFTADVAGAKGPVPGAFTAAITGTDVDLSELTTPALCRLQNLDPTNFVEVGLWDPEATLFYPLLELLPGESYVVRLSRNLAWQYGAGTGTAGPETNRLRVRANTAACNMLVECFEV